MKKDQKVKMCSKHQWKETGKSGPFAGDTEMTYVKCETCGQPGFRMPNSPVVYTWLPENQNPNLKIKN
jgi:hypothetical protein